MTSSTADTRSRRIRAIVDACTVRDRLGILARYKRCGNGLHEIAFRGRLFVGAELEATIAAAESWRDER